MSCTRRRKTSGSSTTPSSGSSCCPRTTRHTRWCGHALLRLFGNAGCSAAGSQMLAKCQSLASLFDFFISFDLRPRVWCLHQRGSWHAPSRASLCKRARVRRWPSRWTRPSARGRRTTTTCWCSSPRTRTCPSPWTSATSCLLPRTRRWRPRRSCECRGCHHAGFTLCSTSSAAAALHCACWHVGGLRTPLGISMRLHGVCNLS